MPGPETPTATDIAVAARPYSVADPHAEPVGRVLDALGTTATGLDAAEAAARLASHGPNTLPSASRRSALRRFLAQFETS